MESYTIVLGTRVFHIDAETISCQVGSDIGLVLDLITGISQQRYFCLDPLILRELDAVYGSYMS